MSLRSRLPAEVSFSLATLSLLSTMRGNTPQSGFPLNYADDLLEELLDYIEELAFDEDGLDPGEPISEETYHYHDRN